MKVCADPYTGYFEWIAEIRFSANSAGSEDQAYDYINAMLDHACGVALFDEDSDIARIKRLLYARKRTLASCSTSMKNIVIIAALAEIQTCTAARLMAADVYPDFPAHINSDRSYVKYSHGRIVEGDDPKPIHERWGIYDFPAIVSRLAEDNEAGVDPESITLVGFSRGGQITALAASQLKPMNINTALLATCWETGVQDQPSVTLSGRLLSIYETTDSALSCRDLAARSARLSSFEEVDISTGKEHGAFYTPLSDWVEPLLLWIKKDFGQQSGR